jgi:hypothetical protein
LKRTSKNRGAADAHGVGRQKQPVLIGIIRLTTSKHSKYFFQEE